jgi:hypothetical protein
VVQEDWLTDERAESLEEMAEISEATSPILDEMVERLVSASPTLDESPKHLVALRHGRVTVPKSTALPRVVENPDARYN